MAAPEGARSSLLLNGDHSFVPGANRLVVGKGHPPEFPDALEAEVARRWGDFVEGGNAGVPGTVDHELVLTDMGYGPYEEEFHAFAFAGRLKPWVTTRPAFAWSDGRKGESLKKAPGLYALESAALCFARGGDNARYLVLRETAGHIDTFPAGFMQSEDLEHEDPASAALLRGFRENLCGPGMYKPWGVIISEKQRKVTACYGAEVDYLRLADSLDVRGGRKAGDGLILLCREDDIGEYVLKKAPCFGERAAAMLSRYLNEMRAGD
jgi:hypothetical protein